MNSAQLAATGVFSAVLGIALVALGWAAIASLLRIVIPGRSPKDIGGAGESWLLVEYDDGVRIYLASAAGGAAPEAAWGTLSLMRRGADGHVTFRRFAATGSWAPGEISNHGPKHRDQNVRAPRL